MPHNAVQMAKQARSLGAEWGLDDCNEKRDSGEAWELSNRWMRKAEAIISYAPISHSHIHTHTDSSVV